MGSLTKFRHAATQQYSCRRFWLTLLEDRAINVGFSYSICLAHFFERASDCSYGRAYANAMDLYLQMKPVAPKLMSRGADTHGKAIAKNKDKANILLFDRVDWTEHSGICKFFMTFLQRMR